MYDSNYVLPKFKCHKIVSGIKIAEMRQTPGGDFYFIPEQDPHASIRIDSAFIEKHSPEIGGYLVEYADGYRSYSPAEAFEEGYSPIDDSQPHNSVIENNFTYHSPQPGQQEKYVALREKAKELAYIIEELCPNSREKSVAMTQLETGVFWANAAIARNG